LDKAAKQAALKSKRVQLNARSKEFRARRKAFYASASKEGDVAF